MPRIVSFLQHLLLKNFSWAVGALHYDEGIHGDRILVISNVKAGPLGAITGSPPDASAPSRDAEHDELRSSSIGRRFNPLIGFGIVTLAICCGLATFVIMTNLTPIKPTPWVNTVLMVANVGLILVMSVIVGWPLLALLRARRERIAGARLHIRIVTLFSLVAAIPALVVAVFASLTLNRGLDTWFSERTQTIVNEAQSVGLAYLEEHDLVLRQILIIIAHNIGKNAELLKNDRQLFFRYLAREVAYRGLPAAYLINAGKGSVDTIIASDKLPFIEPEKQNLAMMRKGERRGIITIESEEKNLMRGLIKVPNLEDSYLYLYKYVDPKVLQHLKRTDESKAEYDALKAMRTGVQLTFAMMYILVSFTFLLASAWFGLRVADRLVEPIVRLVNAARAVSRGNMEVKVATDQKQGDLATLGRTFNQMTNQLKSQRDDLIGANEQLDQRRRFTEAVLSGVSAGVLGLDMNGRVTLVNLSALELLGVKIEKLQAKSLVGVVPAMKPILDNAQANPSGTAQGQITIRIGTSERTLTVQVTTERSRESEHGYVVTFDDMTELVIAQRNSAWADIARRIAHEIKNPLTPIQLSAERLRRKYKEEITSDPNVFEQCTNTIIRQVEDIGRMVDEFSSFARMPKAVLEHADLAETVKEALVLQKASSDELEFDVKLPDTPVMATFDRRLIAQAVTNLVKNAREALEPCFQKDPDYKGRIQVELSHIGDKIEISVTDNGIGLPNENRDRLTEPYTTTREKGTGLGLAIVKRIMVEHKGKIRFSDAPNESNGAKVTLVLDSKTNAKPGARRPPKNTKPKKKSAMGEALSIKTST